MSRPQGAPPPRADPGFGFELGGERGQPVDRRRRSRTACRSCSPPAAPPRVARTSPTRPPTSPSATSASRAPTRRPAAPTRRSAAGRTPTCRSSPAEPRSRTRCVSAATRRNLRLSGLTLAKIFTNKITNWNDPAITADNNGRKLPTCRSSRSCTPRARARRPSSPPISTTEYPASGDRIGGRAPPSTSRAKGTSRRERLRRGDELRRSTAGNGAIGYDEYSYALARTTRSSSCSTRRATSRCPTSTTSRSRSTKAQINHDKSSPELPAAGPAQRLHLQRPAGLPAVVVLLHDHPDREAADEDDHRQTSDARRLPLLLDLPGPGGDGPDRLLAAAGEPGPGGFKQIAMLHTADPKVDLSNANVTTCNNPTFVAATRTATTWPKIAPQPPACDKAGAGAVRRGNRASGRPNPTGTASRPTRRSGPRDGLGRVDGEVGHWRHATGAHPGPARARGGGSTGGDRAGAAPPRTARCWTDRRRRCRARTAGAGGLVAVRGTRSRCCCSSRCRR